MCKEDTQARLPRPRVPECHKAIARPVRKEADQLRVGGEKREREGGGGGEKESGRDGGILVHRGLVHVENC